MTSVSSFRWIVSGRTGTGKTHLVQCLLYDMQKDIGAIYVFSSTATASEWPMIPPRNLDVSWNVAKIEGFFDRPSEEVRIVIIDDFLGIIRRDDPVLIRLFTQGRHSGISTILLTQRLNGFSPTIRANTSIAYITNTVSKRELETLYEEYATPAHSNKKEFYDFIMEATKDYAVLEIDLTKNPPTYRKLKSEPIIPEYFVGGTELAAGEKIRLAEAKRRPRRKKYRVLKPTYSIKH